MYKIQSGAFEGLPSLQMLALNRNRLRSLPTSAFQNTPVLNTLILNDNDFQELPHRSICIIKHLAYLYVQGNQLTNLSFPPCYMNISHLSIFDLSGNPIDKIHKQDFVNLQYSHIRDLRLSDCKLKRLPEDVFAHLQGLTNINLSGNKFETFPKYIFRNLTSLIHLYVSNNRLHVFVPDWTVNSLIDLNLGYNHINSFNLTNTQSPNNIKELIIENNKLVTLSSGIFTNMGLYRVEILNLKKCSLSYISSYAFKNLTCLNTLRLTDNPLTAIVLQQAFVGLPITSLQKLFPDYLLLKDIDNNTFVNLAGSNVTELVLDYNGITKIPSAIFSSFLELRTLSLKGNKIITVDDYCFHLLTKLNTLWLDHNNLAQCISPLLTGLTSNLTGLHMNDNMITRIEPECIDGLDKLRNVYLHLQGLTNINLSGNKFETFPKYIFRNLTSLIHLYVSNNRLHVFVPDWTVNSLIDLNLGYNHINSFNLTNTQIPCRDP